MVAQFIGRAADPASIFSWTGVAKSLGPAQRKELSIQVLAGGESVSRLSRRHGVSRKFLDRQADRAERALDEAFAVEEDEERVLYQLPVSKRWIRQFVLALALEGHSSLRGIGQIAEELLDYRGLSVGTVYNILHQAGGQARAVNAVEDLSAVRVGAHDEIYQSGRPVLVGADIASTYCYLLAEVEHCDETTWGVHLLELAERGLHPDYTVADGGLALRAGQRAAWGSVPCHGDVFHGERELGQLASYLRHRAAGCTAAVAVLEHKMERLKKSGRDGRALSGRLSLARRAKDQAVELAEDISLLSQWLQKDILSLAGPDLASRKELFDFVLEELAKREPLCPHRIEPVRRLLQRQRDDLLAFAGVLDERFTHLAGQLRVPLADLHALCELQGLDPNGPAYWQRAGRLMSRLGEKFHQVQAAVIAIMDETPRASSIVENLNSRLRAYFFLRRQLGDDYLDLLRFFLNHRRFRRSRRPGRAGNSPAELLTGRPHPHWLELLGFQPFQRN